MTIWLAIILGVVQGLTEFLPVSSSGHLLMLRKFFGITSNMLLFDITLHLATLISILIVFRKRILSLLKHPFCETNICLLISTIITCSIVLLFKDLIDKTFTYRILPVTFMLTAIILFATTIIKPKQKPITTQTAIATGIAQGIAVIPGISRSGSTIATGLMLGTNREQAAEYAFLMSIPIIIASFLFELLSATETAPAISAVPLICGFCAALVSGIFAIKLMLKIVKKIALYWFSLYLVIISILLLFLN